MRLEFVSFDSMGARSMATYVETGDVSIFIDPGVALAPKRYGLPPHEVEIMKMAEDWERIVELAGRSEVLVVTHYHYDHHNPNENLEIYNGKFLIVKHPTENINWSQRRRAAYFLNNISGRVSRLEHADGATFTFGNTVLRFSQPVPHGTNTRLGYVVEVLVDDGSTKFLHTSDVEGPSLDEQVDFILNSRPNILLIDGPMTYMLGYRYSRKSLEESLKNLLRVLEEVDELKALIMDHHLLRDLQWEERMAPVIEKAKERGVWVGCVADYVGVERNMLEARRKELYESQGGGG